MSLGSESSFYAVFNNDTLQECYICNRFKIEIVILLLLSRNEGLK